MLEASQTHRPMRLRLFIVHLHPTQQQQQQQQQQTEQQTKSITDFS
jgi:hypothetical protein